MSENNINQDEPVFLDELRPALSSHDSSVGTNEHLDLDEFGVNHAEPLPMAARPRRNIT